MVKQICNICGKEFDLLDAQEGFGFRYPSIGYGSAFDGEAVSLDLCCGCFDKLMSEYILPQCKISPLDVLERR